PRPQEFRRNHDAPLDFFSPVARGGAAGGLTAVRRRGWARARPGGRGRETPGEAAASPGVPGSRASGPSFIVLLVLALALVLAEGAAAEAAGLDLRHVVAVVRDRHEDRRHLGRRLQLGERQL